MAEELLEYENTIEDSEGRSWVARVLGAERDDGTWVGWIRFREVEAEERMLETERETTQPNREDLRYWATGLTYSYLEGALARAVRRQHRGDSRAGDTGRPGVGASEAAAMPAAAGPRLEVVDAPERVIAEVMGSPEPRPGMIREVPDAGAIVYEGSGGRDGRSHYLALRFGSRNSGAVLSNWLWSRLEGTDVSVRVNGEPVELKQEALSQAVTVERRSRA